MRLSPSQIYYGPGPQPRPLDELENIWAEIPMESCRPAIERQLQAAEIPAIFRGCSFTTLNESFCPAAFHICREFSEQGHYQGSPGLLLIGPPGTGKSSLAVASLRRTCERIRGKRGVHFWKPARGLAEIRQSFDQEGEKQVPESVLDLMCNYLVVIDDLGKQKMTEWAAEQLYTLVDTIWEEGKKAIITTNLAMTKFTETMDPALTSRILGCCIEVPVSGVDRRIAL